MIFSTNIKRAAAAIALLPLACCAPAPASAPTPAPAPATVQRPVPQPAPMPAAAPVNWMDAAATPGDWSYRSISGQTQAIFGHPGNALLVMTCNPQRNTVTLFRAGSTNGSVLVRILSETDSRTLTGTAMNDGGPSIKVELQSRDPLLDAIALSKGRFAIETAGMPTLYLPSWAEVTRVIEDCR